jgi:hypothetical protein
MFITGCSLESNNTDNDKNPIDVEDPSGGEDPGDIANPLEGIDEEFILSMDGLFEGEFEGEMLSYYFYLPEDIEFLISIEAEFDSLIVIKDFLTNQIIFEGDDSIFSNDIYSVISLDAGEYIVEVSSNYNGVGSFSILLSEDSIFSSIVVDQQLSNTASSGEIHGYVLEIDEASYYSITSTGEFDLEGIITSIEGEYLSFGNDISIENENFEMIIYLEVGTYIIGVVGFDVSVSITYQLLVETTTISHTSTITENTSINDILLSGEKNIVEFDVTSDGYAQLYIDSMFDSYGIIYNSSGDIVMENDDGNIDDDFYIDVFLESGTYTIEISGFSDLESGNYELFYDFSADIVLDDNVIELDYLEMSSLSADETEIFMLTITEAVTVNIYSESSYDMYGEIFTDTDEFIIYDDESGNGSNFLINNLYLEPGVYYIHVSEFFGYPVSYYELYVDTAGESTTNPGDEVFTIELNTSASGTLGSGNVHSYTFTVTSDGYFTAYLESEFDSIGAITNSLGDVLELNDDATYENVDFKIENMQLSVGTYTLNIYGYSTFDNGDYTVYVTFEESVSFDTEILPNWLLEGTLLNDQINTVTFTLDQGGYINAYLESSFDSVGSLYNSSQNLLLENDDDGDLTNFALSGIYLDPGTYEINIEGFTSGEYGDYVLYLDVLYSTEIDAISIDFPSDTLGTLDDGDYHWFEVEILESGIITTYLDSTFDSFGYLLDDDGKFIETDDNANGSDFYISAILQPGIYYIVVRGLEEITSGDYTLHVEFTP